MLIPAKLGHLLLAWRYNSPLQQRQQDARVREGSFINMSKPCEVMDWLRSNDSFT